MLAIGVFVYAIGGIEGKDANEAHRPVMSKEVCERYHPMTDKWEPISITFMPHLAAFAWTPMDDPMRIAILGGTNGSLM